MQNNVNYYQNQPYNGNDGGMNHQQGGGYHNPNIQNEQRQQPPLYGGLISFNQNQTLPKKSPFIVIYGAAGVGKTTMAITASQNACLFDYGQTASRSPYQAKLTIPHQKWETIVEAGKGGFFKQIRNEFDTIIIDGLNEMIVDCIMTYLKRKDESLALEVNSFQLYGETLKEFKDHIDYLRGLGFVIVVAAQECQQRSGDKMIKVQPCCGSNKIREYVENSADMIGYIMQVDEKIRTISYDPNPMYVSKNFAALPGAQIDGENMSRHHLWETVIKPVSEIYKHQSGEDQAAMIRKFEESILSVTSLPLLQQLKHQSLGLTPELQFILSGSFLAAEQALSGSQVQTPIQNQTPVTSPQNDQQEAPDLFAQQNQQQPEHQPDHCGLLEGQWRN